MWTPDSAACAFKALSDPTRVRILEFLSNCCGSVTIDNDGDVRRVAGVTIGEVCCQLTGDLKMNSTISHHIRELKLAGLITVERSGRNMICTANAGKIADLGRYLKLLTPSIDTDC